MKNIQKKNNKHEACKTSSLLTINRINKALGDNFYYLKANIKKISDDIIKNLDFVININQCNLNKILNSFVNKYIILFDTADLPSAKIEIHNIIEKQLQN